MCLIAFHWQPDAHRPLVVAANRDEFHARPTRALAWWRWPDGVLGGRDEHAGGTWMATRRDGRFAAVTNFRDPGGESGPCSRGDLPLAWLRADDSAQRFGARLYRDRGAYGPFNLVFGDPGELWIVGTHAPASAIEPGVHALSNHLLDTPWPKSIRAVRGMEAWLARDDGDIDGLLDLLDDREPAPDQELPETGVGSEMESLLSAPFVVSECYGTRSSTAMVLGNDAATVGERVFDAAGRTVGERVFDWPLG